MNKTKAAAYSLTHSLSERQIGNLLAGGLINAVRMRRLTSKRLSREMLPGFIRNVTRTIFSKPNISIRELNRELESLGWNPIEIDMHTLDLMLADGVLQDLEKMPN